MAGCLLDKCSYPMLQGQQELKMASTWNEDFFYQVYEAGRKERVKFPVSATNFRPPAFPIAVWVES
jgi:hypothetical protein